MRHKWTLQPVQQMNVDLSRRKQWYQGSSGRACEVQFNAVAAETQYRVNETTSCTDWWHVASRRNAAVLHTIYLLSSDSGQYIGNCCVTMELDLRVAYIFSEKDKYVVS